MQLNKKRELAARVLGIGKGRIVFNRDRIKEINEAITKQDIRDLVADRAIIIIEAKGRRTHVKKTRRRAGSVRKKVKEGKKEYMTLTRKFRKFVAKIEDKKIINDDEYKKLRNEIRAKKFRSLAHMKERVTHLVKERSK